VDFTGIPVPVTGMPVIFISTSGGETYRGGPETEKKRKILRKGG
jgi:hypothetical protein